jgi:hypothetical protein
MHAGRCLLSSAIIAALCTIIEDLAGLIASKLPLALQHAAILFTKSEIQKSTFCMVT